MAPAILLAAIALAVVAAVAWPLVRDRPDTSAPSPRNEGARQLQDDIDRSLGAIREIAFDHTTGNLSDADFEELDAAERARAAELLRERDARGG